MCEYCEDGRRLIDKDKAGSGAEVWIEASLAFFALLFCK